MDNPFEKDHIRNYVLFYVSIVVIMILFFIASTLFHDVEKIEQKKFDGNVSNSIKSNIKRDNLDKNSTVKFKLMDKVY